MQTGSETNPCIFSAQQEREDWNATQIFFFFKPHLMLPEVQHLKQTASQRDRFFTFLFTKVFIVCFILQTPPLELFPPFPPK